jgi:flagellar basal-body rod modification protein FlgD
LDEDAGHVPAQMFSEFEKGRTMQSIQQIVTSLPQVANSASAVANAMARPRASAATGSSSSQAATDASGTAAGTTITANDFLTLLVAEMKNQDPTQPTDPNAYISQMVQVNSLQQLIGINQGVTSLDTATGASTDPSASVAGGVSPLQ